jgi:hypothetical protein
MFYNIYSLTNIIRVIKSRRMIWVRHVILINEMRNAYRILVGKAERNRPLRRPSRRWEYNIEMELREVVCEGVEWIYLAYDGDQWPALVNMVMNLQIP